MNRKVPGRDIDRKIPQILKNRIFLIAAGLILVIAVGGGIYSVLFLRDREADSSVPVTIGEAEVAEVLPQQVRSHEDVEDGSGNLWDVFVPVSDPFADPMKLTGVIVGGRGGSMAIIESSGSSYIVGVGDYVDDLWAVRQITMDMVVLRTYNQEVSLFFDQPPVTRSLDGQSEENDEEEDS